ncbi:MAG TPA: NADPH-dependent FMN reductase [Chthoniobacterales bacterium]|nr:NADPH-dependent FMN reductase [Chthoniobacterales bacterium]
MGTASIRILAISGSLRKASNNSAVLKAAAALAPPGTQISLYTGLSDLPAFNPDLDTDQSPRVVQMLRHEIGAADGLLISSPEYARGLPGSLKNALDWLVSSFEFPGKPVALINTSPRSVDAQAQLRLVLTTMSACLIDEASVVLPLLGRNLGAETIAADPELSAQLQTALQNFVRVISLLPPGRAKEERQSS